MMPIIGATASSFMPSSNGDYYVEITSNILCSNISDVYSVNNIGLGEELLSGYEIYPNPAVNLLTIRVGGSSDVRILDAAGRTVLVTNVNGALDIDVQDWARGAYMVQLIQNAEIENIPLLLQ